VLADKAGMKAMLGHSKGDRAVPVIVEDGGKVAVGFGGS